MGRKKTKPLNPTPFSLKLCELRQKRALSKEALSRQMDISVTYISLLESGERQPSRDMVLKLGQALFPEGHTVAQDELLLLAGFTPTNPDHLQLPKDTVTIFEEMFTENGAQFSTYLGLVMNLIKTGHHAKAQEKIQWGFQHYHAPVQLQSLLAILELSKGDYDGAILTQKLALDRFEVQDDPSNSPVQRSDLLLNLGSMYFLRGYAHLSVPSNGQIDTEQPEKISSLNDFQTAAAILKQAVDQAPQDIYILDEYARVNFNLAYQLPPETALPIWQTTIDSYHGVLGSPNRSHLGHDLLKEACAFLALAYAKSQRFAEAELAINLTRTFCPQDWLIHYIAACTYSLRYESESLSHWLEQALNSLSIAAHFAHPDNRTRTEAPLDPDLKLLRQLRPVEFNTIIKE